MAELSNVSQDFLNQCLTAESCVNGMELLKTLAPKIKDDERYAEQYRDLQTLYKYLDIRKRRLDEQEAALTKPCRFCDGRKVAYVFVDRIGQESAMPEQEYDFYDTPGRPTTCPVCKGVGRTK